MSYLQFFIWVFFFLIKKGFIFLVFFSFLFAARQLGFQDANECPQLCKLAYDYLRISKDCEDNIYAFFSNDPNASSLYVKLIEEFDKCILGYFAFHWGHASDIISQVSLMNLIHQPWTSL